VEKDMALLQAEHKELFATANARELSTKVQYICDIIILNTTDRGVLIIDFYDIERQTKNKKRGKNKISAQLRRKQKNVIDAQLIKLKDKLAASGAARLSEGEPAAAPTASQGGALSRFAKK